MHIGNRRPAFTLIELLIVIVILGVLATLVVPNLLSRPNDAKKGSTIAEMSSLKTVLSTFHIDNGRFPTTEEGLEALITPPPDLAATWKGPYLERVPTDKWQHPYRYICPGTQPTVPYDLYSAGIDGQQGTPDDLWAGQST